MQKHRACKHGVLLWIVARRTVLVDDNLPTQKQVGALPAGSRSLRPLSGRSAIRRGSKAPKISIVGLYEHNSRIRQAVG